MTWILRFFLFVVLFYVIRAFFSRILGRKSPSNPSGGQDRQTDVPSGGIRSIGEQAVKDPQCGIYLDRSLALPVRSGGETLFFCSEKCREEFLGRSGSRE